MEPVWLFVKKSRVAGHQKRMNPGYGPFGTADEDLSSQKLSTAYFLILSPVALILRSIVSNDPSTNSVPVPSIPHRLVRSEKAIP